MFWGLIMNRIASNSRRTLALSSTWLSVIPDVRIMSVIIEKNDHVLANEHGWLLRTLMLIVGC